jgi:eukaryotic-like serine/threonine-protein kinase
MSLSSNDGDVIEYLVAHGAYVEAARICVERGGQADLRRAIKLYERVWRFADALPLAEQLGDPALAVRLALEARLAARATELAAAVPSGDSTTLRAVAEAFANRGHAFEAAGLLERAGEPARAAALYRRADAPLDEARAREAAGELREAGLVYERLVARGTAAEALAARVALGRLLGRFGRHAEAARLLQAAARAPGGRVVASRALCAPLLALGHRAAAAEVLARLRRDGQDVPASPEELVAIDDAAAVAAGRVAVAAGPGERRFHVRRMLGAGATGRVFLADDTLLGQPVALKLLQAGAGDAADAERQAYLRYVREAEAAGRLRHPNIVALHDADPARGLFVLELMSGGTLGERLANANEGRLPLARVRRLALDVLAALGAAHERGIVHRDVKPANVFYDDAGNAKLGDFGAAHLADFGQTQTGGFMGTIAYMSPEQISASPIGFAADLYALGVTLFQALTGRLPFLGPDLVAQHLGEPAPAPSTLRPGLSPAHDEVLLRALAKAPRERFSSAADMAAAIAAWPSTADAPPAATVAANPDARAAVVGEEERLVGPTSDGTLWRRRDSRTARDVLIERRDEPLTEEGLAELRRRAAAGGPDVQRILRLSPDRREIWYEALDGEIASLVSASVDERTRFVEVSSLAALALTHFVRTDAGPVLLVTPRLQT